MSMLTHTATITTLRFAKYKVKVWRRCTRPYEMGPNEEVQAVGRYLESISAAGDVGTILRSLAVVSGVESVEITNAEGDGICVTVTNLNMSQSDLCKPLTIFTEPTCPP